MRIAVIADIHGNADALEAVLHELSGMTCDRIVCLGDHLSGPLEARRTADMLMARSDIVCISGNHDRYLVTVPRHSLGEWELDVLGPSDRVAFAQLEERHLQWLEALPATLVLDDIFCCHGTPTSDETYWLETVEAGRMRLADKAQVEAHASAIPAGVFASLALCAHTHVPRVVRTSHGLTIVNPGSVGCPGYTDDHPVHVMQVGSPDARFAIAERGSASWRVSHHAIPYDSRRVAEMAADAGRREWSQALGGGWIA
ncbi:metallophosphoesterase family protein [Oryzibacter oryziterrae]|uniref:metallophosphoesterase family protein n=1 Tax=Oryzibacter oryziterrae TaxID=2766474 RepID=UPI001F258F1A|nr:metallophosphoesterase family protein [Oryzibacter oryziterrae]